MNKLKLTIVLLSFASTQVFAQNCNCISNFEWVKKTIEENDAGFSYALKVKGVQAYEDHNNRYREKVQNITDLTVCANMLYDWLKFFRSSHFGMRLIQQPQSNSNPTGNTINQFKDWEKYNLDIQQLKKYLNNKTTHDYEGIWVSDPYTVGIKKEKDGYIGFIVESGIETWTKGMVKFKFTINDDKASSTFYLRDHSALESDVVRLIGANHMQIGNVILERSYPELSDETKFIQYFKTINATKPYLEYLNESTLYFRIPSFNISQKKDIDSLLNTFNGKILQTKNLIIDIRNGTGGSDASYKEILPYLYTNPIRTVGVEFYSTKLNNQRMLDIIDNPEWGVDEEGKKWAKKSYDILEKHLGQFINVDSSDVEVLKFDKILPYPENIGIIINQQNGSTDEQFLLAAKQSKKVKLFGTTTYGVLDISNMYFVPSPCNEIQLGYSLSRSLRIPGFTIDEKGIQPDYYIENSIPLYDWTDFVNSVLNEK